ncbi:MAG: hypothetical protein GY920_13245 [Aliivibrio sp.]|nr:hypothetical protein [Aliivibrio sp.]
MTDKLVQQSSRHAVYVQRFGGHLANLFDPYMDELISKLREIMAKAPDTTQDMREINRIIAEYRKASLVIYGEYNDDALLEQLDEFAISEAEFAQDGLQDAIETPDFETTRPSNTQILAAIKTKPLVFPDSQQTAMLAPFIKGWERGQIDKVNNIIRTGFITGKTSQQIVQDIAGKNGYLKNQNMKSIKTMVRTATNQISNVARQATYQDNDDIVIGYEWVSTLDVRTSSICRSLDGTIYKYNDPKRREPPAHPNCRSTTAPALDARFNIDDDPETRASKGVEGGQQVDANKTYYSWLKEQGGQGPKGRAFVEDVLGKERAKLFLDGGLSVERFKRLTIDELFQPIPLEELRKKQSLQLAFDKIG